MAMQCDICGEEATVHELRVVAGKKVEKHLCEKCARKQGIATSPAVSVPELIEKYLQAASKPAEAGTGGGSAGLARSTSTCPTCGTTYLEFRQSGLLGCQDCYRAFEVQLGPLLERAHELGTHHVGKLPRRALTGAARKRPGPVQDVESRGLDSILGGPAELTGRITALRRQLDEAVAAEQYERAAKLRDEIRKIEELAANPAAPSATSAKGGRGSKGGGQER
jgi:protein arginine kinase activator